MADISSPQATYAFTYSLYGVKAPPKLAHQTLRVQSWASSAYKGSKTVEQTISTAPEELLKATDDKMDVGLFVGLRPARAGVLRGQKPEPVGDDLVTQAALDKIKKIEIKRSSSVDSVCKLSTIPIWPLEQGMTRVVVRFNSLHATKLQYYELINRDPVTKLCTAVPVMSEDCFFFQSYRKDGVTTVNERMKLWAQEIKTYLADELNASLDNGGFRPAKSKSKARIEFPRPIGVALDIQGMVNEYACTGTDWLLNEIKRAILAADGEFKDAEVPQLIAVHQLIDVDVSIGEAEAKTAQQWLATMFPNLAKTGDLTAKRVLDFGTHLRKTNTRVTYGKLRTTLGSYMKYQLYHPGGFDNDTACARWMETDSLYSSEDTVGPPPKFDKSSREVQVWLSDHHDMIKAILAAHNEYMLQLIDFHGSAIIADNLHDLWENVASSPDTDAAKTFALQATRYLAKGMVERFRHTANNLGDYVKLIAQAMKDISDEDSKVDGQGGDEEA